MTSLAGTFTHQDRRHFDVDMIVASLEFAGRLDPAQLEQIREIIATKTPEDLRVLRELADQIIDDLTADPEPEDDLCTFETFFCTNVSKKHLCDGVPVREQMRLAGLA